jgi:phosphoglycerate-specific signal transduction histidine kinase
MIKLKDILLEGLDPLVYQKNVIALKKEFEKGSKSNLVKSGVAEEYYKKILVMGVDNNFIDKKMAREFNKLNKAVFGMALGGDSTKIITTVLTKLAKRLDGWT